jgi:hypothetical protein
MKNTGTASVRELLARLAINFTFTAIFFQDIISILFALNNL